MKLFIWHIADRIVKDGIVIAMAPTREEAIKQICITGCSLDEFEVEKLRNELERREPDLETSETYGRCFVIKHLPPSKRINL